MDCYAIFSLHLASRVTENPCLEHSVHPCRVLLHVVAIKQYMLLTILSTTIQKNPNPHHRKRKELAREVHYILTNGGCLMLPSFASDWLPKIEALIQCILVGLHLIRRSFHLSKFVGECLCLGVSAKSLFCRQSWRACA